MRGLGKRHSRTHGRDRRDRRKRLSYQAHNNVRQESSRARRSCLSGRVSTGSINSTTSRPTSEADNGFKQVVLQVRRSRELKSGTFQSGDRARCPSYPHKATD